MSGARGQVGRLLALVPYLQRRGEVSVEQAAKDFGVPAKTIQSDLKVLWFCGLPGLGMGDLIDLDYEALEESGLIRLSNADYLSRPLRLDSTEAAALMVALRTLREGSAVDVREVVDRTLAKLEAAAGEGASLAAQVEVHLPLSEIRIAGLRTELEAAVTAGRQVRLTYYVPARDESTERMVDPIAVDTAQGNAYLDAWCHQAEDRRLFRLDRISAAEVTDEPVGAHPDVAPRDLSEGIFTASPDDLLVTLVLAPPARWVAEYYPVESAVEQAGGGLLVQLRVGDPGWLNRLLLRLGGAATVTDPAGVEEGVREAAARALQNYR